MGIAVPYQAPAADVGTIRMRLQLRGITSVDKAQLSFLE